MIDNVLLEEGPAAVEGEDEEKPQDKPEETQEKKGGIVIDVTDANIGDFTIEDVVMPMVGHDINFPKNEEIKKIITDIMQEDGITIENFAKLAANDCISASGSYRKIVTRPEEVWFDIVEM